MKTTIYTLDYCPYCKAALKFLDEHNVKYERIRIDDNEENYRHDLAKMLGQTNEATVPQIFMDGISIGGYTDMIKKYEKGELNL